MPSIKIYTKDGNTLITGNAVDDNGVSYTQSQISKIRLLRIAPRNRGAQYEAVLFDWVNSGTDTDNSFQGIIPGTLPFAGHWGFQCEFTLVSSGLPVHSKIIYHSVGDVIDTNGLEIDGDPAALPGQTLSLDGDLLLLLSNRLLLS